jgi:hypothetical protein
MKRSIKKSLLTSLYQREGYFPSIKRGLRDVSPSLSHVYLIVSKPLRRIIMHNFYRLLSHKPSWLAIAIAAGLLLLCQVKRNNQPSTAKVV